MSNLTKQASDFADRAVGEALDGVAGLIQNAIDYRRENPLREAIFHEKMAELLAALPRKIDDKSKGVRLRDARVRYHERKARRMRARADALAAAAPAPCELEHVEPDDAPALDHLFEELEDAGTDAAEDALGGLGLLGRRND